MKKIIPFCFTNNIEFNNIFALARVMYSQVSYPCFATMLIAMFQPLYMCFIILVQLLFNTIHNHKLVFFYKENDKFLLTDKMNTS